MLLSIHTMQNLFAEVHGFDNDKCPCFGSFFDELTFFEEIYFFEGLVKNGHVVCG